jgi:hypothetical protein
MIEGLDEAALELQPKVAVNVTYFLPANEKRLISPDVLWTISTVLITAFLAGFQKKAEEGAKGLGTAAFTWLTTSFKSLFGSKSAAAPDKEIEDSAKKARQTGAGMAPGEFELVVHQTEKEFSLYLKEGHSWPSKEAEAFAGNIKRLAIEHVLRPRPQNEADPSKTG